MSTPKLSLLITLLLTIVILSSITHAQTTTTDLSSTQTASSSYNVFSAIASSYPEQSSNDSNGLPSGSPNDNPDSPNPDTAGASGDSQTAITLNTGDIVAISVVVGLVVILGLGSALLFYLAKKRQWEVRASLRRSAKRLTTAFKARTPMKPNFSRRDRGGVVRIDPPSATPHSNKNTDKSKRSGGILKESKPRPRVGINTNMDRDVEKGFGTQTKIEAMPRSSPSPSPPRTTGPKSSFEMDSPLTGNRPGAGVGKKGKGGWMKILGSK
jgi:hypothetical protein